MHVVQVCAPSLETPLFDSHECEMSFESDTWNPFQSLEIDSEHYGVQVCETSFETPLFDAAIAYSLAP